MLKKKEKGQSLVEVALTLPILLLILMGILDLGRAYFTYVALSDAAAEGAAYAAIHPSDTVQIVARATESSNGLVVFDPQKVNVEVGSLTPGSTITVTVEYDYQLLTPIMHAVLEKGTITMKSSVAQPIVGDDL